MKIKVINPNTSDEMTREIEESAKSVASPGTEILCSHPEHGPECVEGGYDTVESTFHLLEEVVKSEQEDKPDAYVIACFGDPGIDAIREMTDAPVIGIAEASFYLANILGARFSVVATLPRMRKDIEDRLRLCGMNIKLASLRTPDLSVLSLTGSPEETEKTLIETAKQCVKEDYAEVIVLGCAGMAGFEDRVSAACGVPVLDTVKVGIKYAEMCVSLGLKTSKSCTYESPTAKEVK